VKILQNRGVTIIDQKKTQIDKSGMGVATNNNRFAILLEKEDIG